MKQTEFAIIGAGPAGMAAAATAASYGVATTVIDEQAAAGGQFLRQPPPEFEVSNWLPGKAYRDGKDLLQHVDALENLDWQLRTRVAGNFR